MPEVRPGSAQDIVSNMADIMRAAPLLKQAPGLTVALARHGGNVVDNAQAVAGVAKARAYGIAVQRHNNDQMDTGGGGRAGFDINDDGTQVTNKAEAKAQGGGLNPVPQAVQGLSDAVAAGEQGLNTGLTIAGQHMVSGAAPVTREIAGGLSTESQPTSRAS